MAKIPNWTRTVKRNADDVGMSGVVREWVHDETGETHAIKKIDPYENPKRYDILIDGETATAQRTLSDAIGFVTDSLREINAHDEDAEDGA